MNRKWIIRGSIVIGTMVLGLVILSPLIWITVYSPVGAGEERPSPDGRFQASAYNYHDRSWDLERRNYIHIIVSEVSTGRTIWDIRRFHQEGDLTIPDYSIRGVKYVDWAGSSTHVTIPVESGQTLTLHVP